MAVDPKLNNAAVLAQRTYSNAVASLAAAQKTIATITAKGGTATAAQTAALTAAQNAVTTSSTAVKSAQLALNAANNNLAVAAGTTGPAVSPAVDSAVKQAKPYNVQTVTGTGPTLSSSNGLLDIAGATALALAASDPVGTINLVGSLFSSAKDIIGVGGTTSSTTAPPAATPNTRSTSINNVAITESVFDPRQDVGESVFDPGATYNGPATGESVFDPRQDVGESVFDPGATYNGPATGESVFDPRQDIGENVFDPGATYNGPATGESVFDPRQDIGENVFDPGATYNGPASQESVFDPRQDIGENVFDPGAAGSIQADWYDAPVTTADPYAGLTPKQLQDLGGADPTDPYIRARLGIPQLPGSILAATPGFGTIKTGIPLVDTALSTLGSLFSFGGKATTPAVTQAGTTTGIPATVDTSSTAQSAAKLRAQDPRLTTDEKINLDNIDGAQAEITKAQENIQSNNRSILANEEAQAAAQEQQRQAQAIIDQNNLELADDTLPDDRRAELLANNAAQRASIAKNAAVIDETQTNIDNATANNEQQQTSIQTNQGVVAENSAAFTANGKNLDAPVVANNDPATTPPVDQNFIDANTAPQGVDTLTDPVLEVAPADTIVQAETTLTILSEEETNALFAGADPGLVDTLVPVTNADTVDPANDPGENVFDPGATYNGPTTQESVFDPRQDVGENVFDPGATVNADGESVFDPTNVDPNSDPFEEARYQAELAANETPPDIVLTPDELAAVEDPFEARRLELEQEANREELAQQATELEPGTDPGENVFDPGQTFNADGESVFNPDAIDATSDEGLPQDDGTTEGIQDQINNQDAAEEAAAKNNALNQATLQARYKQPASSDWRVRLQLAPGANYLYKAGKDGVDAGILKPLYDTDGVIFPYTPSIETSYNANYEMYDLTHSNFRGYFYKNSRVNDINIRATFTAQDTQEAAYLLAVIHFFRSVTKMFYGAKDAYRGAPPPLTYLSGLGAYQFNQHPCVVSQFNYSLPPDVDYIRALAPNNYGQNMLTQRARTGAIAANAGSASLTRLLGTITKPPVGATATPPTPGMLNQNVNNTSQATYVPTKIELSITLLPINTRSQVSTQFNMKEFASGALIKGGFW